jgi:hypothetical protein
MLYISCRIKKKVEKKEENRMGEESDRKGEKTTRRRHNAGNEP